MYMNSNILEGINSDKSVDNGKPSLEMHSIIYYSNV